MGSSGLSSNRVQTEEVVVSRFNVEDVENNNNHIYVNPTNLMPIHALIDELNNNTTLINNNYLAVSLTSPSLTTLVSLNKRKAFYRLPEKTILSDNVRRDKMPKECAKKKMLDEKLLKEKEKENKKKKDKLKAPRVRGQGGGGGRGRGNAEQEKMMRRPRRKK